MLGCSSRKGKCSVRGRRLMDRQRWRVANLREGPLRLDLHLECCSRRRGLLESLTLVAVGEKRWDSDVVVCGPLLAETGMPVVCDSYGAVQLVRLHSSSLRGVARRQARSSRRL
ncbi:hypothetical protein Taro_051130 [Colocasia esculenta]|uniref:Uncharacterized protein n=1 Tax=Colocasia esculenta TaxID=4460 RepID=A0A843XF66_COLES|nr:hypothetical protein [Colocasia esculenta]